MQSKRVLVTESGSGLVRELELEFARQGAHVVLHCSHAEDGVLTARDKIRARGRQPEFFKADFEEVEQGVELGERATFADFLCSEDAGYIIGQTIIADGGTTSLRSFISDFRTKSTETFTTHYIPGV